MEQPAVPVCPVTVAADRDHWIGERLKKTSQQDANEVVRQEVRWMLQVYGNRLHHRTPQKRSCIIYSVTDCSRMSVQLDLMQTAAAMEQWKRHMPLGVRDPGWIP